MLDFENKFSLVMMVAENFRYCSAFHHVKKYLQQGKIGKLYVVFWKRTIEEGFDHHLCLVHGDYIKELEIICKLLEIDTVKMG